MNSHISTPHNNNTSSNNTFPISLMTEGPVTHSVPLLPQLMNSFAINPQEITINSSNNVLTNPKSSSYLMSMKSKSRKSMKSSKDKNSSFLSSLNNINGIANKSKSSSFSKKLPLGGSIKTNTKSYKNGARSYEGDNNNSRKPSFFPNFYFSLNQLPHTEDSPKSVNRKSLFSFKNNGKIKTIKRNLMLYSTTHERVSHFMKKQNKLENLNSNAFSFGEITNKKIFTNHQNMIFHDLAFFEEGIPNKKTHRRKNAIVKKAASDLTPMKIKSDENKFKNLLKNADVLLFKKEFHFICDFIVILTICTVFFWIPIEMAFKNNGVWLFCLTACSIVFSFLNEYLYEKKFSYFALSLHAFSLSSIGCLSFADNPKYLDIFWVLCVFLTKIKLLKSTINRLRCRINLQLNLNKIFTFALIIYRFLCLANLFGCLWIYIGYMENMEKASYSWLNAITSQQDGLSNINLYFRCLASSLSSLTLVGVGFTQGLINPQTGIEYAYICFISVSGIMFLFNNLRTFNKFFNETSKNEFANPSLTEFERILEEYGLDFRERNSFITELQMVLMKNKDQKVFGELLKMMSPSYQENLLMRLYWPIIKRIPVLSKNFSKGFLIKLLSKIKIVTLTPNEILFQEGDYNNHCLYYVLKGDIECYLKLKEQDQKTFLKLKNIKASQYFREFSFFSNQPEKYSAKCQTFSTLLRIDQQDFLDTLKEFPSDNENFSSIKERVNTYKNYTNLYLICESCGQKNHGFTDCPFLTHDYKNAFLLQSFVASCNHLERRIFYRKPKKIQLHALYDQKYIENHLIDIQNKYKDEIEKLAEEMIASDDASDGQANDSLGTNGDHRTYDSKDSQYTYTKDPVNSNLNKITPIVQEEFLGNPPSIFLQTPTKKSRKSMTESIFHENDEEDESDERILKNRLSKTEKTLNELELENEHENPIVNPDPEEEEDDEEEEEYEEEESEKKTSKYFSITNTEGKKNSEKDNKTLSSAVNQNSNATPFNLSQKALRSYQKFFSERESKVISEKDTYHVLQNFEKLNKIMQQNSLTTGSAGKKPLPVNSFVGSYSLSKSNSSSYPRGRTIMAKSSSSSQFSGKAFIPTKNKNAQYNDYINSPLFAFDFDKPKEFKNFMPHNNVGTVINRARIDGLLRRGALGLRQNSGSKNKKSLASSNMANTSLSTKKQVYKDEATLEN